MAAHLICIPGFFRLHDRLGGYNRDGEFTRSPPQMFVHCTLSELLRERFGNPFHGLSLFGKTMDSQEIEYIAEVEALNLSYRVVQKGTVNDSNERSARMEWSALCRTPSTE